MTSVTAVVTGVGAPVGVGIVKALRGAGLPVRVVGVDASPLAQGLFRADRAHLVPPLRPDPELYVDALSRICRAEGAQILFSGWEGELALFAERKLELEQRTGAVLPMAAGPTLTAMDKWLCTQALRQAALPAPDTVLPDDSAALAAFRERHRLPYIVKPRRGSGGRELYTVRTEEELAFFARYVDQAIIQELLPAPDREYTVGVFATEAARPAGVLSLRRELAGGLSYRMVSDQQPDVCRIAAAAVEALGLIGPVNVQLRLTDQGPSIFEINPRCSSATCVRAAFGLNEPELAIRRFVLGEEVTQPEVRPGVCLRFWEELYLPAEAADLARAGRFPSRGETRDWF